MKLRGLEMHYLCKCNNCKDEVTVTKDMKDCNLNEVCEKCGSVMQRAFKLFGIKTGDGIKS